MHNMISYVRTVQYAKMCAVQYKTMVRAYFGNYLKVAMHLLISNYGHFTDNNNIYDEASYREIHSYIPVQCNSTKIKDH